MYNQNLEIKAPVYGFHVISSLKFSQLLGQELKLWVWLVNQLRKHTFFVLVGVYVLLYKVLKDLII